MTGIRKFREQGGYWVVAQVILLILTFVCPYFISKRDTRMELMGISALLGLLGWVQLIVSALKLGKNLTPMPHPVANAELRTDGIYQHVRHPIYGGILLLALAQWVAMQGFFCLVMLLILLVFFYLKSKREEEWLRQKFRGYDAYAKTTKRFLPLLF